MRKIALLVSNTEESVGSRIVAGGGAIIQHFMMLQCDAGYLSNH